jgi:hypothetical protein
MAKLDHAKLSSLALANLYHRFAKALTPSNLRDDSMASNPDISPERVQFS